MCVLFYIILPVTGNCQPSRRVSIILLILVLIGIPPSLEHNFLSHSFEVHNEAYVILNTSIEGEINNHGDIRECDMFSGYAGQPLEMIATAMPFLAIQYVKGGTIDSSH